MRIMSKDLFAIKRYFEISDFLETQEKNDFVNYRKVMHRANKDFGKDNIDKLERYYKENKVSSTKSDKYKILKSLSDKFYVGTFFIGIVFPVLVIMLSESTVNVNIFLLFSIVIPLVSTIYIFYKLFSYKTPEKEEDNRLLDWIYDKTKMERKHNHVLSIYTIKTINRGVLLYATGTLVSLILITALTSVKFHYSSTFNMKMAEPKIISIASMPWSKWLPSAVPQKELIIKSNLLHTTRKSKDTNSSDLSKLNKSQQGAHASWAKFVLMTIFFWVILPKIIPEVFSRIRLDRVIRNSLDTQGKTFQSVIKGGTGMKKDDISIVKKSPLKCRDRDFKKREEEAKSKKEDKEEITSEVQKCVKEDDKSKIVQEKVFEKEIDVVGTTINLSIDKRQESDDEKGVEEYNNLQTEIFKIAYERKVDVIDKVDYYLDDKVFKANKKVEKKALKIRGMRRKDNSEVIDSLGGLVCIYTAMGTSAPDETFQKYVLEIAEKYNVEQIWIIPFIEDEEYRLAMKGDRKYKDFISKVHNLKNDEIRLYNER